MRIALLLLLCATPAFACDRAECGHSARESPGQRSTDPIRLVPPMAPACISSPFGWRHALGPLSPAGLHNGIDVAAAPGTFVRAAAAGRVVKIERMGIGGLQVIVQHPGFTTLYAHLGTLVPPVAEGARDVAAGERLGFVGRSGLSYGVHLFFEVMVDGKPVDPAGFLSLPHC